MSYFISNIFFISFLVVKCDESRDVKVDLKAEFIHIYFATTGHKLTKNTTKPLIFYLIGYVYGV